MPASKTRNRDEETILVVSQTAIRRRLRFRGLHPDDGLLVTRILSDATPRFLPKADVEGLSRFKQIITYLIVTAGDCVLTFRRPADSDTPKLLRGRLCLGFGGHVNKSDFSRPGTIRTKLRLSAMREFKEEVLLPPRLIAAIEKAMCIAAVLNDDTSALGRMHLGVVFIARLHDFGYLPEPSQKESKVARIGWKNRNLLRNDLSTMEKWSRWCMKEELV